MKRVHKEDSGKSLAGLVRDLLKMLEKVEESDSRNEFHPTYIGSCRFMDTEWLYENMPKIKKLCGKILKEKQ